jgi:hypothetical protein
MKSLPAIAAIVFIFGCRSAPERVAVADEPILSWFHEGQTKAEVLALFHSLGWDGGQVETQSHEDGSSTLTFFVTVPARRGVPADYLGTFELTFSSHGILVSGEKLDEPTVLVDGIHRPVVVRLDRYGWGDPESWRGSAEFEPECVDLLQGIRLHLLARLNPRLVHRGLNTEEILWLHARRDLRQSKQALCSAIGTVWSAVAI